MILDLECSTVRPTRSDQQRTAPKAISAQAYMRLLAIYLHQNDLCNAKYLWKRIPADMKTAHEELGRVWTVGQCMWQRNWPAVHTALNVEWSEDIKDVMTALKGVLHSTLVLIEVNIRYSPTGKARNTDYFQARVAVFPCAHHIGSGCWKSTMDFQLRNFWLVILFNLIFERARNLSEMICDRRLCEVKCKRKCWRRFKTQHGV
ncbi:uncharacterized protein LOC105194652 isoform X2 [Solenopsis invicta]|uniref:uncharacterized protein LOC105194652 isoform X2 n=1 Tax=Solenopsis invicta TaxID=13686 RepID=UPI00193D9205|nr:uncharacterized protein LOC105194652 isoform X2 [Solenopsis invicta]